MSIRKETTVDPLNAQFSKTDNVEILNSERVNSSVWLERKSFRISLIATFTALAIVLGYAMAYIPNIEVFTLMIFLSGFIMIPNIEVFTLMIFLSGFIMSKKEGAIIGLLSASIFTFFNPFGPSPPPLFIYQLIHYSLTGISGGLTKNFMLNRKFFKPKEDLYRDSYIFVRYFKHFVRWIYCIYFNRLFYSVVFIRNRFYYDSLNRKYIGVCISPTRINSNNNEISGLKL